MESDHQIGVIGVGYLGPAAVLDELVLGTLGEEHPEAVRPQILLQGERNDPCHMQLGRVTPPRSSADLGWMTRIDADRLSRSERNEAKRKKPGQGEPTHVSRLYGVRG